MDSRGTPRGSIVDVEMLVHERSPHSTRKHGMPSLPRCRDSGASSHTAPHDMPMLRDQQGWRATAQRLPTAANGLSLTPIDRLSVSATPHFVSPPSEIIRHNATEGRRGAAS